MIKHLVTAMLFALGGAGGILVGYLATEPLAFTRPSIWRPAAREGPSAVVPLDITDPLNITEERPSVMLAEVRITATPRRAAPRATLPARLEPCSQWREVGALSVDSEGVSGVRNVRALCDSRESDH